MTDLALAGGAALVVALSPLVPKHWAGKLVAAAVTGTAVLVWRRRHPAEPRADRPVLGAVTPELATVGILWLAVFASTWLYLYGQWTGSVWSNTHGIFVPFVVAFLVRRELREDPEPREPSSSAWGLPLVALGAGLAVLDAPIRTGFLGTVGLLITLPGFSLTLLGTARTRRLAAPLAASWVMLPIPRTLATDMGLRHMTAIGVEWLLDLGGYEVLREATVLKLPPRTFVVSDACSGFATLYAAVSTAFLLACISPHALRRAALLLLAPLLAIAANTLRVLILVVLTFHYGNWFIDSFFHPATGVATFLVILVPLIAIAGRPTASRPPPDADSTSDVEASP